MTEDLSRADQTWPGRVAVGVIHGDPPRVFIAESETVLGRVVALLVVAQTEPSEMQSDDQVRRVREALLDERWGDAVAAWISDVEPVDAYPDELVWTNDLLEREQAAMEIRMAPIFRSAVTGEER